jgi:hypothetical protein
MMTEAEILILLLKLALGRHTEKDVVAANAYLDSLVQPAKPGEPVKGAA